MGSIYVSGRAATTTLAVASEAKNPPGSSGFRRPRAALGDADHRRPQQAVMTHRAGLQYLDNGAGGLVRPLGLKDRLVEIVVENFALRSDALDPVALEDAQQFALCRRNPGKETARTFVFRLRCRQALQRPAQVVGRREQVLGKTGDRIFRGIVALTLRAAAHVLGLSERAQQAILILGQFSLEFGGSSLWRQFLGFRLGWRPGEAVHIVVSSLVRSSGKLLLLLGRRIFHGLSLSDESPDHLGGVVHHRDDAGIVDPSWTDDAARADDLLAAVLVGSDHHRAAGAPENAVFGNDTDLHAFAPLAGVQQTQQSLSGFEHLEKSAQPFEIGERGDVFEQIGLSAHDQRAALVAAGPVGKSCRDELRRQLVELDLIGRGFLLDFRLCLFDRPADQPGVEVVAGGGQRGRRQAGWNFDDTVLDEPVLGYQHYEGAPRTEIDEFDVFQGSVLVGHHNYACAM